MPLIIGGNSHPETLEKNIWRAISDSHYIIISDGILLDGKVPAQIFKLDYA